MSTTLIKSAKVRTAVKAALGAAVITTPLLFAAGPAAAADVQVGDTTVDIGGFVRADMYYDFDSAAAGAPSLLPLKGMTNADSDSDTDGAFGASTTNTRLTFSINTPTSVGDVGGYVEGDFNGSGRTFRLRQAYVTYGNWLIGKTWTTFFNPYFGPTVDFGGNAGGGMNFGRDKQVRYTIDLGNGSNFAVALEASQSGIGSEPGAVLPNALGETGQVLPTLVMRYQGSAGIFSYQAAGLVRQLEAQQTGAESSEDSVTSWAVNVGGQAALSTGTTLKLMGSYGQATGLYIFGGGLSDAYWNGSDLEATTSWAATATVAQKLTNTLSVAAMYSIVRDEQDDNGGLEGTGQQYGAGLFYSPVAPLTFGFGYKHVDYKSENNAGTTYDGSADRITFATTYAF